MKKIALFIAVIGLAATVKGQAIPKWKMTDVVNYFSKANDTLYVVNFWATFCKPCIEEMPGFLRVADKYKDQKVKLLLVSLDLPSYYPARILSFAKKNKFNAASIVWLNETNADIFCPMIDEKWSGAIPATIIVNGKTGYKKFFGDEMKEAELESEVKKAMGIQ